MSPRPSRRRVLFLAIVVAGLVVLAVELYLLSASVRLAVVAGAERIGADEYLIGRMTDRDLQVRSSASDALVRRGPRAVPALAEALEDPETDTRRNAAACLARMGPNAAEAIPALLRVAIEDEEEVVLETAGQALGIVARGNPPVVNELLELLKSGSDEKRLAAIRASARLEDSRAVPPLIESLRHKNAKVREEAAEALGELKGLAAVALAPLTALLTDPEAEVRSEARQAITRILRANPEGVDPRVLAQAKLAVENSPTKVPGEPATKE